MADDVNLLNLWLTMSTSIVRCYADRGPYSPPTASLAFTNWSPRGRDEADSARWAIAHPERFRLTFGRWDEGTDELAATAAEANANLMALVVKAQNAGELPGGEPERMAALLLSLAHGAADRALGGHLSAKGKGRADAEDLVDDLFRHLRRSAKT